VTTAVVYSSDAQVDALADNGGTLIGASGSIQVIRMMGLRSGALAIDAGSAAVGTLPWTRFRSSAETLTRTSGELSTSQHPVRFR